MRVLMLNKFAGGGGAARAALRLHDALGATGVESQVLVDFKAGDHPGVLDNATALTRQLRRFKYADLLPVKLAPKRPFGNFSPAWLPDGVARQVARIPADLVHLHWLGAGFLRLESLARFNRPLVWTLHDSWAFTGGCHVPFDCTRYRHSCGACPVLGSERERDLSRWVWRRKRRAWAGLDLTVVTPSNWLAECARSSSLFAGRPVVTIPNGIDTTRFRPMERPEARAALGLPQEKYLVLFGGIASTRDRNKGYELLTAALLKLPDTLRKQLELVVFGSGPGESPSAPGIAVRAVGRVDDDARLARLYAAADLFAAPSLLENLPNTVMEAMACGTPAIGFRQGGMADLIEPERTGYLARPYGVADLAAGVERILTDGALRRQLGANARAKIEREFAIELTAERYARLYREIVDRNAGRKGGAA